MSLKVNLVREMIHDIYTNATPHEIEEIITDLIAIRDVKLLETRLGINLEQIKEEMVDKITRKYGNANVK